MLHPWPFSRGILNHTCTLLECIDSDMIASFDDASSFGRTVGFIDCLDDFYSRSLAAISKASAVRCAQPDSCCLRALLVLRFQLEWRLILCSGMFLTGRRI